MPIFGRFTERTQRVLNAAGREAAEVGTKYIGPEHLLLGLLSEDDRLPPEIEQHITYDQAKDMLSEMHLEGPELTERLVVLHVCQPLPVVFRPPDVQRIVVAPVAR